MCRLNGLPSHCLAGLAWLAVLLGPVRAVDAADLVVGGYTGGTAPGFASSFDSPDLERFRASQPAETGSLTFDFTPRRPGSLLGSIVEQVPAKRLVVGAGSASPFDAQSDLVDVGLTGGDPERRFSIGGALEFESFSLLGGYSRVNLMGQPSSVLSAGVDYGRVSTSLAFGQTDDDADEANDILMFSTDLSALSWLTVESDVALGSDDQDQSMAAGRIGFRLDF